MSGREVTSMLAVSLVIVICAAGPSVAQPTALDFTDSADEAVTENPADRMLPDRTLSDETSADETLPDDTFSDELLPDNVVPNQNPRDEDL